MGLDGSERGKGFAPHPSTSNELPLRPAEDAIEAEWCIMGRS
jgi:hypothetical protein